MDNNQMNPDLNPSNGNEKNLKTILITISITLALSFLVFYGFLMVKKGYEITFDNTKVDYKNVLKFNQVKQILQTKYYKNLDENKILEGAIAGMAEAYNDPYTVYYNKEQMNAFTEKTVGAYVGIGVSVKLDDNGILTVIETFEGSPALKEGIVKEDKIVKVNDEDVATIKDEDIIINKIKGKEDTEVKITIYRPSTGKNLDFKILRQRIKVQNVKSELLANDIGYIRIVMFDSNIAKYFKENLNGLLKKGMKGLIIDVRDNPGGNYDQVVEIVDRLLPKALIVYTEDRSGKRINENSDSEYLNMPIVILVNENSASASEVLSGALKDNKKAVLVGAKTYGKGLVQSVYPLSDGSGLKLTTARYFTPSGVCINKIGIKPDYEIENEGKFKNYPVSQLPKEEDKQLAKAIEVLNQTIKR